LIFAPHANSYDRMVPGAHAPTGIAWAYENRTAAIRIPSGPDAARRIEHRMAGADVNPYLMIAAVLGAALSGIEEARMPPAPITGNAYALNLPQVPQSWEAAVDAFETCDVIKTIFPEELIRNLLFTKRQEIERMAPLAPDEQRAIYLDTV
ncbi:MAG: glutamine synthetase, partial [Pseudomonadota bacterium]